MSKGGSGLFKGTNGSTADVWNNISATQPNYAGTEIPRSFVIKTPKNSFWVHGNATEHMADYLIKQSNSGRGLGSTKLDAQLMLSDMRSSITKVTQDGIKYNTPLKDGNWEFVIKPSRNKNEYDLIIHAMYKK